MPQFITEGLKVESEVLLLGKADSPFQAKNKTPTTTKKARSAGLSFASG